jgi:hypothetical protein
MGLFPDKGVKRPFFRRRLGEMLKFTSVQVAKKTANLKTALLAHRQAAIIRVAARQLRLVWNIESRVFSACVFSAPKSK